MAQAQASRRYCNTGVGAGVTPSRAGAIVVRSSLNAVNEARNRQKRETILRLAMP
jgi:hypothetical protein